MASKPNDSPDIGVNVEAIRARINTYKAESGLSWAKLAARIDIPDSTLSLFASGKYTGDNTKVAQLVAKWFAADAEQEELRASAPIEVPHFQETRAAKEVISLLRWSQRGKIGVAATSPGFGKTSAARQYQAMVPNVWLATMAPSTSGVATMLAEILEAMGERDARGSPQMLTKRIRDRIRGTSGLILLDDTQHISEKALEELRGIHDVTGIGIALLGNAGLLQRLEGGSRHVAFAQLFSRVSLRVVRTLAYPEDAHIIGRAWGVTDPAMLRWLGELVTKPGGLRGVSMTLELASIIAAADRGALTLANLQDAWAQLSTRPVSN